MQALDSAEDFVVRYQFPSQLALAGNQQRLELATDKTNATAPCMFEGKLLRPKIATTILLLLPKLAMTRFYTPPNLLAQILAMADPVFTCGSDIIRLESLSACASAYARMDIDSNACNGEFLGKGTTNVDFQPKLRDALTAFTAEKELDLSVGKEQVKISIEDDDFIERKVKLPSRWQKGFAELSAYQSKMSLIHEVSKMPASRFLQTLPGNDNDKAEYYVVKRRNELALTQQKQQEGLKIAGLARLKILKSLIPYIDRLRIYGDQSGNASSWLIHAGPYRLEFVVSAAPYRGFSGEGQLLAGLASTEFERHIAKVRAALNWQTRIEPSELATACGTTAGVIDACLARLGSSGSVGFDSLTSAYFHRELPFKPERTLSLNPRLRGAKEIVEGETIEIIEERADLIEARVEGSDVKHTVRKTPDSTSCTCVWFAKHQNNRGPCKHILSLQILLQNTYGE